MRSRVIAVVACAVLSAGLVGIAPASADDSSTDAASTWEMPDLDGMILQKAVEAVYAASGDPAFPIKPNNPLGQNVYNLTNWEVCDQSPRAGREVTQKTKTVYVAVKRLNAKTCYG